MSRKAVGNAFDMIRDILQWEASFSARNLAKSSSIIFTHYYIACDITINEQLFSFDFGDIERHFVAFMPDCSVFGHKTYEIIACDIIIMLTTK